MQTLEKMFYDESFGVLSCLSSIPDDFPKVRVVYTGLTLIRHIIKTETVIFLDQIVSSAGNHTNLEFCHKWDS